jgi:hypothetical protein
VLILNRPFLLSGMNDVLNSQGYTQAAWWNRIPIAAWIPMLLIAALSNVLLSYGMHGKFTVPSVILPLAVSISFFLIADIDSPRGGVIRIPPQNLYALADSLKPQ